MYAPITATVAIAALLLNAPTLVTVVAVAAAVAHLTYDSYGLVKQWRAVKS